MWQADITHWQLAAGEHVEILNMIKARPTTGTPPTTHFRVRQDKVDEGGRATLRHNSRLHHIGIGRAHKGRAIKLLIADQDIRIVDQQTGQLIRELPLDPTRDYQPIAQA